MGVKVYENNVNFLLRIKNACEAVLICVLSQHNTFSKKCKMNTIANPNLKYKLKYWQKLVTLK